MKLSTFKLRYMLALAIFMMCVFGVSADNGTLLRTIEAENFDTTSFAGVKITESEYSSGGMEVENISPSQFLQYNNVIVPTEGCYKLRLHYYNRDKAGRNISAWTNQQARQSILAPDTTGAWNGGPYVKVTQMINGTDTTYLRDTIWSTQGSKSVDMILYFRAGANKLRVGGTPGSTLASGYCPNFDYFELFTTDSVIAKPTDVPNSFAWDYTNEATITSDKIYSDLWKLTDNNDQTFFEVSPNGTSQITFEFKDKMYINGCLFYLGEDAIFNPDIWEVQYSENGTDWSSATRTSKADRGLGKVYMLTVASVGFKYIRLNITSNELVRIGEFQLFGYPRLNEKGAAAPYGIQYPDDLTGTIAIDPAKGTFSADDPGLTAYKEVAVNAIDGIQNKYTVAGKKIGMNYEFNEPTRVASYSLSIGSSSNMGRNPKSWKLSAADYDQVFNVIAEVTNFTFPQVDYNCMKFNVTTLGDYVYYRIDIDGAGDSNTHVSEWQLWGDTLVPPPTPNGLSRHVSNDELCNAFGRQAEIKIIKTTQAAATYQVVDLLGKVMKQGVLNETQLVAVKQGIYVVRVFTNEQVQIVKVSVK